MFSSTVRIASGRDKFRTLIFHTSLGALTLYIPAAGYGLSGSMGGAMPVGMVIVILLFAAVAAEIPGSRMQKALGLPLAAFLLLLVAAPANPGERIGDLTFAMFYNRLGWASLGLLLVMYLPRLFSAGSKAVDAACASFLVLLMVYTKITYGVVELAFLVFLATDRRQIGWTALALGIIASSVLSNFSGAVASTISRICALQARIAAASRRSTLWGTSC
ncbi:hypothetical protein [Rhizobium laguerreae]|uniref:hypothetical protein n=1 Tax=Rhizobium laguerreae TaxID=1076926 RepID=UPI001FEDAECC|nr:hypothetical protein [Rhizobium laguerreae]